MKIKNIKSNSRFQPVSLRKIIPSSKRSNSRFQPASLRKIIPGSKRSQSGVIGAVLLILIVIVTAMVVMSFVVPFVKKQLEGTGGLEVIGKIEITNNLQYTCYNSTNMSLQIHYGDIENLTQGFQVTINSEGSSKSFDIISGTTADNISMLDGTEKLILPGKNEERTYVLEGIDTIPDSIEIYPILINGDRCEASDSLTSISTCSALF